METSRYSLTSNERNTQKGRNRRHSFRASSDIVEAFSLFLRVNSHNFKYEKFLIHYLHLFSLSLSYSLKREFSPLFRKGNFYTCKRRFLYIYKENSPHLFKKRDYPYICKKRELYFREDSSHIFSRKVGNLPILKKKVLPVFSKEEIIF